MNGCLDGSYPVKTWSVPVHSITSILEQKTITFPHKNSSTHIWRRPAFLSSVINRHVKQKFRWCKFQWNLDTVFGLYLQILCKDRYVFIQESFDTKFGCHTSTSTPEGSKCPLVLIVILLVISWFKPDK